MLITPAKFGNFGDISKHLGIKMLPTRQKFAEEPRFSSKITFQACVSFRFETEEPYSGDTLEIKRKSSPTW